MKPIVPILGVASALWLFLGTWWMSNMVCTPNNATTFSVNDGKFSANSADMFTFLMSSDKMEGTENTTQALKKVAAYLAANPDKQLVLTGLYGGNEKNSTSSEDLGLARAKKVKGILVDNDANEANIRVTSMRVDNLSFNADRKMMGGVNFLFEGNNSTTSIENATENNDQTSAASGSASSDVSFSSGASVFLDITEANNSFTETESFKNYMNGLKEYINSNPNKKLILTCYNNDSGLATTITRKVKSTFRKMGLTTTSITRKTGKEADSPNGIAGVNIEIQ